MQQHTTASVELSVSNFVTRVWGRATYGCDSPQIFGDNNVFFSSCPYLITDRALVCLFISSLKGLRLHPSAYISYTTFFGTTTFSGLLNRCMHNWFTFSFFYWNLSHKPLSLLLFHGIIWRKKNIPTHDKCIFCPALLMSLKAKTSWVSL